MVDINKGMVNMLKENIEILYKASALEHEMLELMQIEDRTPGQLKRLEEVYKLRHEMAMEFALLAVRFNSNF